LRKAGKEEWIDNSLANWPENDYRIYCCNLGNEVNEDILKTAFSRYTSFNMCKVIRDKKTEKSKGYAFVSIADK
jgi:RNA recognition motif-containing protein